MPPPASVASRRPSLAWITILDALIIVSASAAIVITLGGRTRFVVGDTLLSLRAPLNPALIAAVLLAVRLALARRGPLLPALARPGGAWATERERFAAPAPLTRRLVPYALLAVLASLVWLTPHLLHPRRVADSGDPVFSAWRLARLVHQAVHDPRHLFDGGMFHPAPETLAYSDAAILQALLGAPFVLAGVDPLIVSNLVMLLGFPLSALAFFYAGWRLTGDPRAACITGVLGALYPFRFDQYSHIEMQITPFVPLAAIVLMEIIVAPTKRRGLLLGALVTGQWLASMYLGVMLLMWLAPLGVALALGWARRPWRPLIEALAVAGLVTAVSFGTVAIPYLQTRAVHGDWGRDAIALYSAVGPDYRRPNKRMAMYDAPNGTKGPDERRLFPGLMAPVLGAAALVPPAGTISTAMVVAGAAAFDWSLGFHGLTYDDLYRVLVPLRGMRVPARVSLFVGTSLVLLAAIGLGRIFAVADRRRGGSLLWIPLAALALVDLRADVVVQDYWPVTPSIYAAVTPSMVLAEYPMGRDDNIAYLYFATTHGARLVNGYSSFFPRSYLDVADAAAARFPSDAALDAARRAGATHITVNCRFPIACGDTFDWLDASGQVTLVASGMWEKRPVRLYALTPLPRAGGRSP